MPYQGTMRPGRRLWLVAALSVLGPPNLFAAELADTWRGPPPGRTGLLAILRDPPPIDADLVIQYRGRYLSPDAFFEDEPVADRLGREQLASLKEQVAYEQAREAADLALEKVLRASPVFVEIARFRETRRLEEFFGTPVEPEPEEPASAPPSPPPVPRKVVAPLLPGGVSVRVGARIGVTRFEPAVQVVREPIRGRVSYSVTRNRLESALGTRVTRHVGFDVVHTWFTEDGEQAVRFTVSVSF